MSAPRRGASVGHDKALTAGELRCLWRVAAFRRMLEDFRRVPAVDVLAFCHGRLTREKTMQQLIKRGLVREMRCVPWVRLTASGVRVLGRLRTGGKAK